MSCFLIASAMPRVGMSGLIDGVNSRNTPTLFLAEFAAASALLFGNFGQCDQYIHNFGKYALLRHGRRQVILLRVYRKIFSRAGFLVTSRIAVYSALTWAKLGSVSFEPQELLHYTALYLMVLLHMGLLQLLGELTLSANAGLLFAYAYYILSVIAGGILIEKGAFLFCLFLTPNFYMRNRAAPILEWLNLNSSTLYLLLTLYLSALVLLCQIFINRKDIF